MFSIKFITLFVCLIQLTTVLTQSKIGLDNVEFAIGEKDQVALKYEQIEYPTGFKRLIECDGNQKISIKFSVIDKAQSKKDLTVQQSAILFINEKTSKEIIYFLDQDRTSLVYSKDINLNYKGKEFNFESGDYLVKLIVGNANTESINWQLGKLNIQFNQEQINESSWLDRYQEKPEIVHQFRKPEKRPSEFVSHTFTLFCFLPVVILAYCWSKIGLNLSKFQFSLSAICFHGSLFLIFTLYTLFFIRLNMFQLLKCLSGVLLTSFISGHYLLKKLNKSN